MRIQPNEEFHSGLKKMQDLTCVTVQSTWTLAMVRLWDIDFRRFAPVARLYDGRPDLVHTGR